MTFGTATFSKELLFGNTYRLNFFSGHCSCKDTVVVDLFQNTTYSRPFFWSCASFYLKRGVASSHSFLNYTGFFWRISLSHPFFHIGWFFNGVVAAIHSFKGYMEKIIFDSSFLSRTGHLLYLLCFWHVYIERSLLCDEINSSHSFFSMVASLYHRSPWNGPYVKDTVFISQHLL